MADNDPALLDLLLHAHEERNLEYKGSNRANPQAAAFAWGSDEVKSKLARTAMAMANIGGGAIVIGMDQVGPDVWEAHGLTADVASSYQQDSVQQYFNRRADPYVVIAVRKPELDGKEFVVVQIEGFDELPVVCTAGSGMLRQGAIYTRSRRMHETLEVQSQTEMRELLDRAIAVGVARRLEQIVPALERLIVRGEQLNSEEQYRAELGPKL